MSNIHYFQRYSQRENVVTNNTLLLLSRIHNDSTLKFANVITSLVEDDNLQFGVRFSQQTHGKGSVPDGMIDQAPCRLLIETKLNSGCFGRDQLLAHLKNFKDGYNCTLLLLAPRKVDRDEIKRLVGEECSSRVVSATFEDLISLVRANVSEYELELQSMITDYEEFCYSEGLIDNSWQRMRLVLASGSLEDNQEYGLYYHPTDRGYSDHGFIGLYSEKSIRGLGKISQIVCPQIDPIAQTVCVDAGSALSEDEKTRILQATVSAKEDRGWDLTADHVFFLTEGFVECDFRKSSKYAPMGARFFNLSEYFTDLSKETSTEEIVAVLNAKDWA